jgi:anti-anti-sigma regulatory factor
MWAYAHIPLDIKQQTMDIRARTLIAFIPLVLLLAGVVVALPLIGQQSQQILAEQIAAADNLTDTQRMGQNLLLEHVAVGQIIRGNITAKSERFWEPHNELKSLLEEHTNFAHATADLDREAAAIYDDLGQRYEDILGFAQNGNLVSAQQLYNNERTQLLLDNIIAVNLEARDVARASIDQIDAQAGSFQRQIFLWLALALTIGIFIALALSWALVSQLIRPIERLTADAELYASGEVTGQLSPVSNIGQLRRLRDAFQNLIDANTSRQGRIQQNLDELGERIAREEHLRETVQALSVPVVPLQEGMLLLPLIGHLDDRRSAELIRGLLEAIQRHRAKAVVLDITGLAELGATSSQTLRHAIESARLLGCQVYLVGVRASQAIELTESHLAEADIIVARDIPSVLARVRSVV